MARKYLFPYKMGSKSGKAIAKGLGIKRIRTHGNYKYFNTHTIINWGAGVLPPKTPNNARILNHPSAVAIASNKLKAYQKLLAAGNVNIPEFSQSRDVAQTWLGEGETVLCRSVLNGHGGIGIKLVAPEEGLTNVPLYVKYVKKKDEYRVHVVNGAVIDYVQKKLRTGSEGNNHQIRNFDNGWIFTREGVVLPEDVKINAINAVKALGLDFGAVDVGFNVHHGVATVYEVNTAPGMEGTTVERYVQAFLHI